MRQAEQPDHHERHHQLDQGAEQQAQPGADADVGRAQHAVAGQPVRRPARRGTGRAAGRECRRTCRPRCRWPAPHSARRLAPTRLAPSVPATKSIDHAGVPSSADDRAATTGRDGDSRPPRRPARCRRKSSGCPAAPAAPSRPGRRSSARRRARTARYPAWVSSRNRSSASVQLAGARHRAVRAGTRRAAHFSTNARSIT